MIRPGAVRIEPSTGFRDRETQGVRLLSERILLAGAPISLSHRSTFSTSSAAAQLHATAVAPRLYRADHRSSGLRSAVIKLAAASSIDCLPSTYGRQLLSIAWRYSVQDPRPKISYSIGV